MNQQEEYIEQLKIKVKKEAIKDFVIFCHDRIGLIHDNSIKDIFTTLIHVLETQYMKEKNKDDTLKRFY